MTRRAKNRKVWEFFGKFSKLKPKPKMANQTQQPRQQKYDPDPSIH